MYTDSLIGKIIIRFTRFGFWSEAVAKCYKNLHSLKLWYKFTENGT